jgi:hypothetical protein
MDHAVVRMAFRLRVPAASRRPAPTGAGRPGNPQPRTAALRQIRCKSDLGFS